MTVEEKIELAREQREDEYKYAVEEFKTYLPQKQARIVEYMKKVSEITEWIFLWIWDDTPCQEQFEKIFKILPNAMRKKVLRQMHDEGGEECAIYRNESVL